MVGLGVVMVTGHWRWLLEYTFHRVACADKPKRTYRERDASDALEWFAKYHAIGAHARA